MSEHSRPYAIHSDEECERRKRVETLPFTGRRRFPWSVDAPADDARAQAVRDAERSNKLTALGQTGLTQSRNYGRSHHQRQREATRLSCVHKQSTGGVRPNASENIQISHSTTVLDTRGVGSRPQLASVLQ
jgi:hypothetical protein